MRSTVLAVLMCFLAGAAEAAFPGVSLKVGNETEPPGGMVQMKVFITEPTPISTGGTKISLHSRFVAVIDGISLHSAAGDAYGAAVVNGTSVKLRVVSPSATLGMAPDYPAVTITARIRPDVLLGSRTPLAIDPADLSLAGSFGNMYATETKDGQLTIAPGVSVTDVTPGSSRLGAGDVVTIRGMNFTPFTTVRISETRTESVRFVDSSRLEVTLATATNMHGQRVRVTNPDGSSSTYFSYQRTRHFLPSARPLLARSVPIFPDKQWSSTLYVTPETPPGRWFSLAVQNLNILPADLTFEVLAPSGVVLAASSLALPANARLARETGELLQKTAAGRHLGARAILFAGSDDGTLRRRRFEYCTTGHPGPGELRTSTLPAVAKTISPSNWRSMLTNRGLVALCLLGVPRGMVRIGFHYSMLAAD